MQIHVPTEQTKQQNKLSQRPAQLFAESQTTFDDVRPETTQLKKIQAMISASHHNQNMRTIQAKTDVKENKDDATHGETPSKKIATPTQGTKWFRFAINGNVIDSFSSNIYPHSIDKGSNPVETSVEIGSQATAEGIDKSLLGDMSRPRHFGLGDRAIGKDTSYRKGKLTWHHQMNKYDMELVDMYVHGAFGHHGGYASWSEDDDDADGA